MKKIEFADVLDAAASLSIDAREELMELLHKRTIEEHRTRLAKDFKNARAEHKKRKTKITSVHSIMKEILS